MPNLSRLRPQLITVNQGRANPLTKPKMVRCEGGGQEAEAGEIVGHALEAEKALAAGIGFVPAHQRRANPFRRKGAKTVPSNRRISRRDSGRRH